MFARLCFTLRWLTFVALVSGLCWSSPAPADEAADDYAFAAGLFKKEKWLLADEAFQKFVTKHPKHDRVPLARYYLGLSQFESEKYAEARKTLRAFVTDYPQNTNVTLALFKVAECSYFLDDFATAITEFQQFEKAIQSNPQDPDYEESLAFMGDAQRRLKRQADAVATFEKALKLYKSGRLTDEVKFGLAHALEATGQADRAIELFREVASTPAATRADGAQLGLANLHFAKEQYELAAAAYLKLEKDFPKSRFVSVAQLNAGYALYRQGQFANAMAAFDRAEKTATQAVSAGYWKGLCAKALGDYASAATILESVLKIAGRDPLAEQLAFQLADSELRAGHLPEAEKWFIEVATRWPQGQHAAQSLYFAAECVLEQVAKLQGEDRATKLKQCELLLDRFSRDYAKSPIAMSHRLQRGQFLAQRGSPADLDAAETTFKAIIAESQKPQTLGEARYRLGRLRQSRGNQAGALEALKPLVDELASKPELSFKEALVVYSAISLAGGQLDEAIRAAGLYVAQQPKGSLQDQALGTLAQAQARKLDWAQATAVLDRLTKEHAESPLTPQTARSLAEIAYEQKQWDRALQFFGVLSRVNIASPLHATAVSGLGWSHFQKGSYAESEAAFRQFLKEHPKHDLASEAGFMIGDSLQKAGKLPEARLAFLNAFRGYQPQRYAFLAGLQASRIAVKQKLIPDADKSYAELDAAYPQVKERDQVLNEWATVLYDAQQFERADELFRKLVAAYPESPLADNAQFNLAESDLVSGKLDAAAKSFRQLTDSVKSDKTVQEDALQRLNAIYVEQKQWKEVVATSKAMETRFAQSRYRPEMQFQAGNAQLNLKEFSIAEQFFADLAKQADDKTLKSTDWIPHVWVLLAEAQLQQKKYSDVQKTADRVKQAQPEYALQYRMDEILGRAFKNQAPPKFDEARQAFERVIASPQGARTETACKAQFMIGETYFFQKNHKVALEAFQKVYILYQFPEWKAAALFESGACEENLGQKKEAIKTYTALLTEFPNCEFVAMAKQRLTMLEAGK